MKLAIDSCCNHRCFGDVHTFGAANAEGLLLTDPFYWDLNDRTRNVFNMDSHDGVRTRRLS